MSVMLLLDALHLRCQTFRGSSAAPRSGCDNFFFLFTQFLLSTTNQIILCSYYVQLSTTLCKQLRTIAFCRTVPSYVIEGVTKGYYNCQYYVAISRSHQYIDWQYQGIDAYFCGSVVYPEFCLMLLSLRTTYPIQRMGIFASLSNT